MMNPAIVLMIVLHVAAGAVALLAGIAALIARKGRRLHRRVGTVFVIAMVVMAVFADILAVVVPGELPNFFVGTLAAYLVITGWLAARPGTPRVVVGERAGLALIAVLTAPFVLMCGELILGLPFFFKSATPIDGYVKVAMSIFALIGVLATASDLRQVVRPRAVGRAAPRTSSLADDGGAGVECSFSLLQRAPATASENGVSSRGGSAGPHVADPRRTGLLDGAHRVPALVASGFARRRRAGRADLEPLSARHPFSTGSVRNREPSASSTSTTQMSGSIRAARSR